jgi:hypothetical protein
MGGQDVGSEWKGSVWEECGKCTGGGHGTKYEKFKSGGDVGCRKVMASL